ncbi:MAG TPA: thioester reductase domain-containing protein [Opitutaceae bacterium]|nr:thioester reductase domain-containing protein [Opitutaceae bacterium]
MHSDKVLDPSFVVVDGSERPIAGPSAILLTGATGFLGSFILNDLLDRTDAEIFCLTRDPSAAAGRARVAQNLRDCELRDGLPQGRLHVFHGDVLKPCLGLAEADYRSLAREIDGVVHSAAVINFYHPYERLRAANVGGTREILAFANQGRAKILHYISSSGVFDSRPYWGSVVRESDRPLQCDKGVTGYTQSKWVAECLVAAARDRGLPVCIHRPPFITGHSQSGVVGLDNLIVRMMVGCIQGGFWPDVWSPVDLVPVDYVSRAVATLVGDPMSLGRTFHYGAPGGLRWADIGRALLAAGFGVEMTPYGRWKQELRRFTRVGQNALRPLAPLFLKPNPRLAKPVPDVFIQPPRPFFDSTVTREYLSSLGIDTPVLDQGLFARYCDFFMRKGWVAPRVEIQLGADGLAAPAAPRSHG